MKFQIGKLFDNKTFLKIFSIVLAAVCWLIVVKTINRYTSWNFSNVSVDTAAHQADVLTPIGLNIVEGAHQKVSVRIYGDRDVLSRLNISQDILVTADLTGANIVEPGVYENVRLVGTDVNRKGLRFESISPDTVTLRVDRLSTKKFPVTTNVEGLKIPEEYLGSATIVSPQEIQITGPDADIQRIARCVAFARFENPLTKTTTVKSKVVLYDSEGNEINSDLLTISSQTADLTIPVNKQKRVPVKFEYLDVPDGFPLYRLEDILSQGFLDIAGPENLIDSYDVYNLGYVNVNEISKDKVFIFTVSLPNGFINVSNVDTISLEFDLEEAEEAVFAIPGENIIIKNIPTGYNATVTSTTITGVQMIGDRDVLEMLTGQEIVAEIDLLVQDVSPGSYSLPVRISVPNKGFVWAVGKYTVVINMKEKT